MSKGTFFHGIWDNYWELFNRNGGIYQAFATQEIVFAEVVINM